MKDLTRSWQRQLNEKKKKEHATYRFKMANRKMDKTEALQRWRELMRPAILQRYIMYLQYCDLYHNASTNDELRMEFEFGILNQLYIVKLYNSRKEPWNFIVD